jgi:hypothetical protein
MDVTILLQGVIHKDVSIEKILKKYSTICKVIVSIYDTDLEIVEPIAEKYNVKVVVNNIKQFDEEQKFNLTNKNGYYQVQAIKSALPYVTTKYIIKSRVDHYYENIEFLITSYFKSGEKITSSSLFVRGPFGYYNKFYYHLSDCLFMVTLEQIKKMILCLDNWDSTTVAEVNIWRNFLKEFIHQDTYIQDMLYHVNIIPIKNFEPFCIKIQNKVITEYKEDIKTQEEYVKNGI